MRVLHSQNIKSLLSYPVKVPHKSLTNLELLLLHLFFPTCLHKDIKQNMFRLLHFALLYYIDYIDSFY